LANAETERMFRYPQSELIGQGISNLIAQSYRSDHEAFLKEYFAKPSPRPIGRDIMGLRKDGSEFPMEVYASHVRSKGGTLMVLFLTDVSDARRAEETIKQKDTELRQSAQEMRSLATGLLNAQEEERKRLSRELHDDLNQKLAMLVVDVESLEKKTHDSKAV